MAYTNKTPDEIAARIKAWNKKDVSDLLAMLEDLREAVEDSGDSHDRIDNYVTMSALPSAPIPQDVDTSYPVWAMDADGDMLVGADAYDIMSLADYRAERAERDE
jgi:hypothetical protein